VRRGRPRRPARPGDATLDKNVNFLDYVVIATNYGAHLPEPATLAILAMGGAWLVFRRHRTRTRTKGEAGMRNAAKKMAGLGVAVLMLAAAGVCQAAVTIDLSITADTGTKTWQVHATVTDPSNESLGLHGIGIDVWGSQTQYGPWTGGLSVNDGTDPLGEIVLPVGACPTYWWTIGFGAITVPGDVVGTGIELMGVLQPSVHQQRTISSVIYNSILKGAGETSGSAPVLGGDVSWAHPVLVAEGTYTGDFGWLNVSLYKDQAGKAVSVTVLPASLPAATTGGAPFATFSPMAGTNYRDSVFVPEPATLALVAVGIGAVVLRMRRG